VTGALDMPRGDDGVLSLSKGNSRHSGFERDAFDWYCEDATPVDQLLDHEDFSGLPIYDPSCGRGNILDRCKARGLATYGSDVVDRGARASHDWLQLDFLRDDPMPFEPDFARHAIICNPPYGRLEANMPRGDTYAERFIRRALALGPAKVAMIVNGKFLWSERRWRLFDVDHPPTQLCFCSERPSMPPGSELDRLHAIDRAYTNGSIDYVWLLWVRGAPPRPPAWLKPTGAAAAAAADLFTEPKDAE
jgi:hypothetical protein